MYSFGAVQDSVLDSKNKLSSRHQRQLVCRQLRVCHTLLSRPPDRSASPAACAKGHGMKEICICRGIWAWKCSISIIPLCMKISKLFSCLQCLPRAVLALEPAQAQPVPYLASKKRSFHNPHCCVSLLQAEMLRCWSLQKGICLCDSLVGQDEAVGQPPQLWEVENLGRGRHDKQDCQPAPRLSLHACAQLCPAAVQATTSARTWQLALRASSSTNWQPPRASPPLVLAGQQLPSASTMPAPCSGCGRTSGQAPTGAAGHEERRGAPSGPFCQEGPWECPPALGRVTEGPCFQNSR